MIVVAGEALVDLIPTPAGDLGVNLGGGPFNTARWLGRPGADVGFLGSIAADPLGQRLRMGLLEAGVALDLVVATELPTTLAVAQLDASGAARYSFYTDGTSSGDLAPEQALARLRLPEALDALYLGGVALVIEPSATALARAVEAARGRGAVVMLDPNVRASLIGDRAAYLERLWGMLAQTDVLKLSVDDLAGSSPARRRSRTARARSACGAADRRRRGRDRRHRGGRHACASGRRRRGRRRGAVRRRCRQRRLRAARSYAAGACGFSGQIPNRWWNSRTDSWLTTAEHAASVAPSSAAENATRVRPASASFGEGFGESEISPHNVAKAFLPARAPMIPATIEKGV
ncbi:MAG TPA: PfkB family carbohydrate kinase [Solirubrobacteraceae bacterium]|nr:PfkB family carbohydrate kinase [Solirubrobacteraceae bacterium]